MGSMAKLASHSLSLSLPCSFPLASRVLAGLWPIETRRSKNVYININSGKRALTFPLVPDAPFNAADAFPEALLSGPEPRIRRAEVFEFL
jgi:hypothetical protein